MKNQIKFHKLILCLLFAVSISISCNQEIDERIDTNNAITIELKKDQKNEYLKGQILSAYTNKPISNVTIKKGEELIAISDGDGSFVLKEKEFPKEGLVYIFEHDDYLTISKRIKSNSKLIIFMKNRSELSIIDSREGGEIILEKEGFLKIPSDAFIYEGRPYNGPVAIQTTFLDASNQMDLLTAPGSFIADEGNGRRLYPLTSFGMIEVLATIPEKELPLELNPKTPITVGFPITVKDTPEKVNLYEMNVITGYWEQTGILTNQENVLLGEITSVNSSWNADEPCGEELICVELQVIYTNGDPGCGITAKGLTYQGSDGHYQPDFNGFVEFMVCPDSVFQLGACLTLCCVGGPTDPCCSNPYAYTTTIDMSTITPNPNGCTSLGVWTINN